MLEAYLPSSFLPMMISSYVCDSAWILDQKKSAEEGGNMLALSTPKTWWGGVQVRPCKQHLCSIQIGPHCSTPSIRCVEYEWINSAKESTHHFTGFLSFGPPENLFHLSVPINQKVSLIIGIAIFPARL